MQKGVPAGTGVTTVLLSFVKTVHKYLVHYSLLIPVGNLSRTINRDLVSRRIVSLSKLPLTTQSFSIIAIIEGPGTDPNYEIIPNQPRCGGYLVFYFIQAMFEGKSALSRNWIHGNDFFLLSFPKTEIAGFNGKFARYFQAESNFLAAFHSSKGIAI
jgi:hypothetical protein